MADDLWSGGNGDWDYAQNWSSGAAPSSGQSAVLNGQAPDTITGSGYFSSVKLETANVTLSGDFEGFDGTATVSDVNASQGTGTATTSTSQTLDVSSSGFLIAGQITLSHTVLSVQGGVLIDSGILQAVTVSGSEGFLGVGTEALAQSLTVIGGALASGDLSFGQGGAIVVDDQSSLGSGTLSATGQTSVQIQSTNSSNTYSFANGFDVSQVGCFAFSSATGESLSLEGGISGTGTLAFDNQSVTVSDLSGFSGTLDLTASSMVVAADAFGGVVSFELFGSSLTMPQTEPAQAPPAQVVCGGASDTVSAGAVNVVASATGTAALLFTGGIGAATVNGGAGSMVVNAGSGDTLVRCGTGSNLVTVGGGSDTVYGSSGASINVISGGQTTVAAGSGNEMVNATGSTGNNTYVGGSGGGTTTIRGGAGSSVVFCATGAVDAVGGTGDFIVSGGLSGMDTLIGGSGNNTLFGRSSGTQIHGSGSGTNLLVASTGGIDLDATKPTGDATLFAVGGAGGVTTLAGGSGSDILAAPNGQALVLGGSGADLVWGGVTATDTIVGGTGNTTIVGGAGSQIQLNGSAEDVVLAYGAGATVNATSFNGNAVIWAGGSGTSNVVGGGGSLTIVAGTGTLHAVGGSGYNAIWGGNSGHDTIIGGQGVNALFGQSGAFMQASAGSTDFMEASGSNVTLNGAASSGWEHLIGTEGSSNTVIYAGTGTSDVQALGTSSAIHVVGGQVSLECGLGMNTILLDSSSVAGTLTVFGFDASKDQILDPGVSGSVPNGFSAMPGGGTVLTYGSETVILHGSLQTG